MPIVRPKNLNFFTIRFPLPAIASLLHRLSGLALFLLLPLILWAFQTSLSAEGFEKLHQDLNHPFTQCLFFVIAFAFVYHFFAGIRHLLSDLHIGTSKQGGKISVIILFTVIFIGMFFIGMWL